MTDTIFCTPEQLTTAACDAASHACTVANGVASCHPWTNVLRAAAKCAADECCTEHHGWASKCLIRSSYSHWIIIGLSIFAIVWGVFQAMQVKKVVIDAAALKHDEKTAEESRKEMEEETDPKKKEAKRLMLVPQNGKEVLEHMTTVQGHIKSGAKTFLKEEYTKLAIFCAVFSIILACAVDQPWNANEAGDNIAFPMTTMAFLVGAGTSMICGYIGMMVATDANAKVTSQTAQSIGAGFNVAF